MTVNMAPTSTKPIVNASSIGIGCDSLFLGFLRIMDPRIMPGEWVFSLLDYFLNLMITGDISGAAK